MAQAGEFPAISPNPAKTRYTSAYTTRTTRTTPTNPHTQRIHGPIRPTCSLESSHIGRELSLYPLHSRMPTAEQQAIFQPPPPGKRKVIVSTVLAETSITVEDIVYVVDTGRTRSTFLNEASLVSALRTVWYSKANGFQRRGRAGRCRPGVWYRLYTSWQWDVCLVPDPCR